VDLCSPITPPTAVDGAMAMELGAPERPPDGSVRVVDSPDDLEGPEVEVRVPDGTTKRYLVDHAERLNDRMVSVSLRLAAG
jgi:hypothetical protein